MKRKCPVCEKEYNTEKIVDAIIKDHPDDENNWILMKCPNYNNHFKILRKKERDKLSKETKQKILDLIHQGKTVGEVKNLLDLDTMIVAEVICQNIGHIAYLKKEIK